MPTLRDRKWCSHIPTGCEYEVIAGATVVVRFEGATPLLTVAQSAKLAKLPPIG